MSEPPVDKLENWFHRKWRPAMAWAYIAICIFDFIAAPILWSIFQASYKGNVTNAWLPLTLQGAGLFHMAMGAILGVTAWKRSEEKIGMMSYGMNGTSRSTYERRIDRIDSESERDGPAGADRFIDERK